MLPLRNEVAGLLEKLDPAMASSALPPLQEELPEKEVAQRWFFLALARE